MASRVIHRKKSGAAYVYSVESYWDKEKKAPRNKQVCLGRLNEETGEIIPSKRRKKIEAEAQTTAAITDIPNEGTTARARVYGPSLLLNRLAKETGLASDLKKCFPSIHNELMSLVFFLVQKGLPLSRCERWSENHIHPHEQAISSQRVSELLKSISEDERQHFLSLWLKRLTEKDYLCYDSTSVSSYAEQNEYLRWGHNRDGEKLMQLNLAMLFGQNSGLPAYYRRMPGNITDVKTLQTTIKTLDYLGQRGLQFVLDRGFYSEANVNALLEKRHNFVLMVPSSRLWVRELFDQYYEKIMSPSCYSEVGDGEVLYMTTHLHSWGGRRCYVHLYYNAVRAAEEYDKLTKRLIQWKKELETGNRDERNATFYDKFFIIKERSKRGISITYNDEEIARYRKRYAGFTCILTTKKMRAEEALKIYRQKDIVENCFDDMKNSLDMRRLRIHSSEAMDSRLFIQFLALILLSSIRKISKQSEEIKSLSIRDIMEAMECVVKITYSGRYGYTISETSPLQRKIMNAFNLNLET